MRGLGITGRSSGQMPEQVLHFGHRERQRIGFRIDRVILPGYEGDYHIQRRCINAASRKGTLNSLSVAASERSTAVTPFLNLHNPITSCINLPPTGINPLSERIPHLVVVAVLRRLLATR